MLCLSPKACLNLLISVYEGCDIDELKETMQRIGARISFMSRYVPVIGVSIPVDEVWKVEALPSVQALWLNGKVQLTYERVQAYTLTELQRTCTDYARLYLNESTAVIGAKELWNLGKNGSGVVIAIIDSGINVSHPDFHFQNGTSKVTDQVSFVQNEDTMDYMGHGTYVAGVAAGTGRASSGAFMGVAPGALLMNVKAFSKQGEATFEDVMRALEYAAGKLPDIISMSWGTQSPLPENHPMNALVTKIVELGITCVASAGNLGYYWTVGSPANAVGVISVGAVTKDDERAWFSSRGPDGYTARNLPTVSAPGVNVAGPASGWLSEEFTLPENPQYMSLSGTSVSAPHVSGAAALLLSAYKTLTPTAITSALSLSAKRISLDPNDQGAGRIDVHKAYTLIASSPIVKEPSPQSIIQDQAFAAFQTPSLTETSASSVSLHTMAQGAKDEQNFTVLRGERLQLMVLDDFDITWGFYESLNHIAWFRTGLNYTLDGKARFIWSNETEVVTPFDITLDAPDVKVGEGVLTDGVITLRMKATLPVNETYVKLEFLLGSNVSIGNVSVFEYLDADVDGVWFGNEGAYIGTLDAVLASQTHWIGLTGNRLSSAHMVGDEQDVLNRTINDTLTGSTYFRGALAASMKWGFDGNIYGVDAAGFTSYIAFSTSRKELTNRLKQLTSREAHDLQVSVKNPIQLVPDGVDCTLNVEAVNYGTVPERDAAVELTVVDAETGEVAKNSTLVIPLIEAFETVSVIFKVRLPREAVFKVTVAVKPVPGEGNLMDNSVYWRVRAGRIYRLISVHPSKITGLESPLITRFPGDIDFFNVTLYVNTFIKSIDIVVTGSAKDIVRLSSVSLSNVYGVAYTYMNLVVQPEASPGRYEGEIRFLNGTEVLASITVDVEVVKPRCTVLWEDALDLLPGWQDLYAWYISFWKAVSLENVRVVSHALSPTVLTTDFDAVYMPDPLYAFDSELSEGLIRYVGSGGTLIFFVGRRLLWVRDDLAYHRLLKFFGLEVVRENYARWSNASIILSDAPKALEGLSNLTVVQPAGEDTRGISLRITPPSPFLNGTTKPLIKALDNGIYAFFKGSDEFLSAAVFEGAGGLGNVFAYTSDYTFDDFWSGLIFSVNWTVESGKPVGNILPKVVKEPANMKLAAYTSTYLPSKPPTIVSITFKKSWVFKQFEALTATIKVNEADTPLEMLRVVGVVREPDGRIITIEAQPNQNLFTFKFTPEAYAPPGYYELTITVSDQVGSRDSMKKTFRVLDQSPVYAGLIIGTAIPAFILGYILSERSIRNKRGVKT